MTNIIDFKYLGGQKAYNQNRISDKSSVVSISYPNLFYNVDNTTLDNNSLKVNNRSLSIPTGDTYRGKQISTQSYVDFLNERLSVIFGQDAPVIEQAYTENNYTIKNESTTIYTFSGSENSLLMLHNKKTPLVVEPDTTSDPFYVNVRMGASNIHILTPNPLCTVPLLPFDTPRGNVLFAFEVNLEKQEDVQMRVTYTDIGREVVLKGDKEIISFQVK